MSEVQRLQLPGTDKLHPLRRGIAATDTAGSGDVSVDRQDVRQPLPAPRANPGRRGRAVLPVAYAGEGVRESPRFSTEDR